MTERIQDDPRIHNCMMTGYMHPEYEDPYLAELRGRPEEDDRGEDDDYERE